MTPLPTMLLIVPLLAALAPVITRIIGRWVRLPIIVFELLLGILVGPSVLGLIEPTATLSLLADFGVSMLFFMAGTELNGATLRGRTGRNAWLGWFLSFALGIAVGWLVAPGLGALVIGIALSSTALGTLIPILRDNHDFGSPFGNAIGAIGAVGELGPIIAIAVLLSDRPTGASLGVLAVFAVIAAAAIWRAQRFERGRSHLHRFVESTLHTSGQFAIRLVLLILATLVALSIILKIDLLLGAFAAGLVWRALISDASPETRAAVESKVDGLAFGFLIPLFFITTGISFNLAALLDTPWTLALVPVVTIVLLVVRGLPSAIAAPAGATTRTRLAVALMGATGLPIIIVATTAAVEQGLLTATTAAVLVGGGMLSVLVYPALAGFVRARAVEIGEAEPARADS